MSTPTAPRENRLPAETVSEGVATEEIFLSPRVIDRAAFESYAERLRRLIGEIGAEATALRATIEEAKATHRGLGELGSKNREHLEVAAKLLKSLTQRSAAVEEMLARAQDVAGAAGRFEQEAERIIEAKSAAFERKMSQALESLEQRLLARVEARERQSAAVLDEIKAAGALIKKQVDQSVVGSVTALREACERAESLAGVRGGGPGGAPAPGSLGDLVRRASDAAEKAQSAARSFEEIESRAGDAVARLGDSLAGSIEFTDRIIAQRKQAEEEADRAVALARDAEQALVARATEAAKVFKPVNEARRLAEEASDRLRALVNQAETLQSSGGALAGEVRALVDRAEAVVTAIEPWREVLLNPADDGTLPAPISCLVDSIRAEMAADLSKMAAAMTLIASRAAAASAQIRATVATSPGPDVVVRSVKTDPAPPRRSSSRQS